jgi:hypothetical protein
MLTAEEGEPGECLAENTMRKHGQHSGKVGVSHSARIVKGVELDFENMVDLLRTLLGE